QELGHPGMRLGREPFVGHGGHHHVPGTVPGRGGAGDDQQYKAKRECYAIHFPGVFPKSGIMGPMPGTSESMKVVIILPTYNERGNIAALLASLGGEFRRLQHDMHILVVDDNSPDGTADIVRAAMKDTSHLHLITGEKAGLGAAYIRGMRHALDEMNPDVVFEMDADFSHDPADVPRL